MSKLYLLPTTLGESPLEAVIPQAVQQQIVSLRHFVVENLRTARRYLRRLDAAFPIDEAQFFELDKHTNQQDLASFLAPIAQGFGVGIISEAGCPGVADPGADVVRLAHRMGIEVVPLVGPSSILLLLMASGLNGQNFAFVGYLPIPKNERQARIKVLEQRAVREGQAQVFIEAPYRNQGLFDDLLASLQPNTLLTVATNLTLDTQRVRTLPVAEWKKQRPELHKELAIFAFGV